MKELFKPLLLNIGPITITPFGIGFGFAMVWFFYSLWKNLTQDHEEESVISFSILGLLTFLTFGRIAYAIGNISEWGVNPLSWFNFWSRGGFSYFSAFWGLIAFSVAWSRKRSWNIWLCLEALTKPILLCGLVISLGLFLSTGQLFHLLETGLFIFVTVASKFLSQYRSFTWYPSGRVGFLFLASLAIFSLIQAPLDFYLGNPLYWRDAVWLVVGLISIISLRALAVRKK